MIIEDITIEKLAHGGDGLGHLPDGRVIFVERGIPGDVVDVEITKEKKSWAKGRIASIRQPAEARQTVGCEAFERGCGGCQFWGMDFDSELEWKVQAAWEAMKRISGLDLPEPGVVEAPSMRDYRSRVTFHQRRREGKLRRGFYAAGSRDVVPIEQCPIARPEIDEANQELGGALELLGKADIGVETTGDGGVVVHVELGPRERIDKDDLEELARRVEQGTVVRGIEVLDETGDYYVIGDTTVQLEEVLAEPPVESMRVESGRFRQVNRDVNARLVDYVTSVVEECWERPRIVELFCGMGNFSFALAPLVDRFVGFEKSRGAVETARQIAALSGDGDDAEDADNGDDSGDDEVMVFKEADLSEDDDVARALEEPFEVLIVDPPRRGAPLVVEQLVAADRRGQLIYISCDPACLARDAKNLADGGWKVERLRFFDMFPRTSHLEAVAVFER